MLYVCVNFKEPLLKFVTEVDAATLTRQLTSVPALLEPGISLREIVGDWLSVETADREAAADGSCFDTLASALEARRAWEDACRIDADMDHAPEFKSFLDGIIRAVSPSQVKFNESLKDIAEPICEKVANTGSACADRLQKVAAGREASGESWSKDAIEDDRDSVLEQAENFLLKAHVKELGAASTICTKVWLVSIGCIFPWAIRDD